ncbi:hypothetical protein D3C73_1225210 [compost metagenome]
MLSDGSGKLSKIPLLIDCTLACNNITSSEDIIAINIQSELLANMPAFSCFKREFCTSTPSDLGQSESKGLNISILSLSILKQLPL